MTSNFLIFSSCFHHTSKKLRKLSISVPKYISKSIHKIGGSFQDKDEEVFMSVSLQLSSTQRLASSL